MVEGVAGGRRGLRRVTAAVETPPGDGALAAGRQPSRGRDPPRLALRQPGLCQAAPRFAEDDEPAELHAAAIGGNNAAGPDARTSASPSAGVSSTWRAGHGRRGDVHPTAASSPARPAGARLGRATGRRGPRRPMFGSDQAGRHRSRDEPWGARCPSTPIPLFENALRAADGRTLDDHARPHRWRCGPASAEVAATNPHAWIRTPRSPDEIVTVTDPTTG